MAVMMATCANASALTALPASDPRNHAWSMVGVTPSKVRARCDSAVMGAARHANGIPATAHSPVLRARRNSCASTCQHCGTVWRCAWLSIIHGSAAAASPGHAWPNHATKCVDYNVLRVARLVSNSSAALTLILQALGSLPASSPAVFLQRSTSCWHAAVRQAVALCQTRHGQRLAQLAVLGRFSEDSG